MQQALYTENSLKYKHANINKIISTKPTSYTDVSSSLSEEKTHNENYFQPNSKVYFFIGYSSLAHLKQERYSYSSNYGQFIDLFLLSLYMYEKISFYISYYG